MSFGKKRKRPPLSLPPKPKRLERYHPGELEQDDDSDFWADHDERCHGLIDELKGEYPEGFKWTCCGEKGDQSSGCEIGKLPKRIHKKTKYHHDGELEVDYESEVWVDHYEEADGEIDTDENRYEYPEGFIWSCCGEVGGKTEGCVKGDGDTLEEMYGPDNYKYNMRSEIGKREKHREDDDEEEDDDNGEMEESDESEISEEGEESEISEESEENEDGDCMKD